MPEKVGLVELFAFRHMCAHILVYGTRSVSKTTPRPLEREKEGYILLVVLRCILVPFILTFDCLYFLRGIEALSFLYIVWGFCN